jgi:hypothetical protein
MTEELMAPLTGLSNLQCLRLSLPFWSCSWGWLQKLLRLTSLHISDGGKLAWHLSFRHVECFSSISGKVIVSPVTSWQCGNMPTSLAVSVCTGWGSERFELKWLAHLTALKEATVRCLVISDAPVYQQALHLNQAGLWLLAHPIEFAPLRHRALLQAGPCWRPCGACRPSSIAQVMQADCSIDIWLAHGK